MEVPTEWSRLQVFSRSIDRPTLVHNGTHDIRPSPRPLFTVSSIGTSSAIPVRASARGDFQLPPFPPPHPPPPRWWQTSLSQCQGWLGLFHNGRNCLDCQRGWATLRDIVGYHVLSLLENTPATFSSFVGDDLISGTYAKVRWEEKRREFNLARWILGATRGRYHSYLRKMWYLT